MAGFCLDAFAFGPDSFVRRIASNDSFKWQAIAIILILSRADQNFPAAPFALIIGNREKGPGGCGDLLGRRLRAGHAGHQQC